MRQLTNGWCDVIAVQKIKAHHPSRWQLAAQLAMHKKQRRCSCRRAVLACDVQDLQCRGTRVRRALHGGVSYKALCAGLPRRPTTRTMRAQGAWSHTHLCAMGSAWTTFICVRLDACTDWASRPAWIGYGHSAHVQYCTCANGLRCLRRQDPSRGHFLAGFLPFLLFFLKIYF